MTRASLPVSTSQAVVGAIIGWNIFTGSPTDINSLTKIVSSWVISPFIAGIFGFLIFKIVKNTVLKWKIHMLEIDSYTRTGLIIVGAMASYSMGANNIANVMGMFAPASPFYELKILNFYSISGIQQLFLLGGLAIAVGIFTYGNRVMKTVGTDLYKISPITGFVIVLAGALVLWLFTSQSLETLLLENGLPSIPLVPLSATQSFIGAVIGVGLAKDPQSINFRVFGKIGIGWVVAPITAGILAYVLLFFVQNVFEQKVIQQVPYEISESVVKQLNKDGIETKKISDMVNKRFLQNKIFRYELLKRYPYNTEQLYSIFHYAIIDSFKIDSMVEFQSLSNNLFSKDQIEKIKKLHGTSFSHMIDFDAAFFNDENQWGLNGDLLRDKNILEKKNLIQNIFRITLLNKAE